jgi:hypothetical protein
LTVIADDECIAQIIINEALKEDKKNKNYVKKSFYEFEKFA